MFYDTSSAQDEITIVSDYGNCIVCGATGSNCAPEHSATSTINFLPPKKADPLATFTVGKRVYETVTVGKREIQRLLYPIGAKIRIEEARRIGLVGG